MLQHFTAKPPYDMVGLFFTHFPPALRADVFRDYASMLSPGGMVVAEMFSKNSLA
ncbi:MAG: hypothetical protein R3B47_08555 [Bacteroidia bacterium]